MKNAILQQFCEISQKWGEKNLQEFWFGHCEKEWATTSAGVRQGIKEKKKKKPAFHCLYNYHRELLIFLWLVIIKIKLDIPLEEECWAGSGVPAETWLSQGSRISIFSNRAGFTFISQLITYGQELCRKWWVEQLKPQITVTFYNKLAAVGRRKCWFTDSVV